MSHLTRNVLALVFMLHFNGSSAWLCPCLGHAREVFETLAAAVVRLVQQLCTDVVALRDHFTDRSQRRRHAQVFPVHSHGGAPGGAAGAGALCGVARHGMRSQAAPGQRQRQWQRCEALVWGQLMRL